MSMDKSIPYYLAGPMSWIPRFNFPAFDAAAAHLRQLGYTIVSPAELDSPEVRAEAMTSVDGDPTAHSGTWGQALSRDIEIVADRVKGIILLPGWVKSRGARLETYCGIQCGHVFGFYVVGEEPYLISAEVVKGFL